MDFGEKDYNLLVKLKELVITSERELLMEKRLDVIHRNIVYTDGGGGEDAKAAELDAMRIYEEHKLGLQSKYKL